MALSTYTHLIEDKQLPAPRHRFGLILCYLLAVGQIILETAMGVAIWVDIFLDLIYCSIYILASAIIGISVSYFKASSTLMIEESMQESPLQLAKMFLDEYQKLKKAMAPLLMIIFTLGLCYIIANLYFMLSKEFGVLYVTKSLINPTILYYICAILEDCHAEFKELIAKIR